MSYSGGDTLRDDFRNELDTILAAHGSITWVQVDTLNAGTHPDAASGYFDFEFPGGSEEQFSFGAPGSNFWREGGQVTLRVIVRRNAGATERNKAESYARTLRDAFRGRRFGSGSLKIEILTTGSMGGGHDEAGMWVESVALGYRIFNVG